MVLLKANNYDFTNPLMSSVVDLLAYSYLKLKKRSRDA